MSSLSNNDNIETKSREVAKGTLRGIALFEAAKGLLVLVAGFGLLSLLNQDVEAVARKLLPGADKATIKQIMAYEALSKRDLSAVGDI